MYLASFLVGDDASTSNIAGLAEVAGDAFNGGVIGEASDEESGGLDVGVTLGTLEFVVVECGPVIVVKAATLVEVSTLVVVSAFLALGLLNSDVSTELFGAVELKGLVERRFIAKLNKCNSL